MAEENIQTQDPKEEFENKLATKKDVWSDRIRQMTEKMKNLGELQNLLNVVYVQRQICVEEHSSFLVLYGKLERKFKENYMKHYNTYKYNSQIRYSSDSVINSQIEVDLASDIENKDLVKIYLSFLEETKKTIDDLIFGITQRIKLHELINGIK